MATVSTPWTVPTIPPLDETFRAALRGRIDRKTKPLGSLGRLETIALQIGLMQGTVAPKLLAPTVVIFAGDHGLAREGVSPYPSEVTPQMVKNFLAGGAGINVFARLAGLPVKVVDAGVASDLEPHPDLLSLKVRAGTRNALHEPALTDDEVTLCLERGAQIAKQLSEAGTNAILPGEMGIGNSSAAALLCSTLLRLSLNDCVGVGAGHDAQGLARKRAILLRVQERHASARDPLAVLGAFGGCEIAMMTGAILEAASRRMLILVDGHISTAAAVVAMKLQPAVLDYCLFSHVSGDAPHRAVLTTLEARPILDLDLRLGEGTGAALAWPIVRAAVAFLEEMATFDSAGVSEKTEPNA